MKPWLEQMTRTLLSILLIVLCFSVEGQNSNAKLLKKAYKKQSQEMLVQFFQNWDHEISPITANEFDHFNDTLKNAYWVFQEFYTPDDLKRIGGSEFGEIYKNVNYMIAQNDLLVYQTDQIYFSQEEIDSLVLSNLYRIHKISESDTAAMNLWKRRYSKNPESMKHWFYETDGKRKDSVLFRVENFRPITSSTTNVVYLTTDYSNTLLNFLGEIEYQNYTESDKREAFLENQILISQGLFNSWHLITYPYVRKITFDKNFEYAEIQFRILHEGGDAILKKTDGVWNLLSSKRTWIE